MKADQFPDDRNPADPNAADPNPAESGDAVGPTANTRRVLTRRNLIVAGGAAALGLAGGGVGVWSALHRAGSPAASATKPVAKQVLNHYHSTSLTIPKTTSWKQSATAAGLLFVEPQVSGFRGLIMDDSGEPVWIEPTRSNVTDLRVQQYKGKPALTYWTGKSLGGHGEGAGVILDASYTRVANVRAGNGLLADLHEFTLTSRGTALLTAYSTLDADLSAIGGPVDGHVYDCHVQEVDIATSQVLLDWNVMDHVPIRETYLGLRQDPGHDGTTAARAFDAYHLNAISEDGDALLVSLRHTHTVYRIDRVTGEIRWRLGGKHSDFTIAPAARFAWQHDVRRQPNGQISLFDNHLYAKGAGHSRGMFFELDTATRTATNTSSFTFHNHLGTAMGSVQLLDNGHVLVGWGTDPAVTEFEADGTAIYEATLGGISYRAYRWPWQAQPSTVPDIAVDTTARRVAVYASWNGATEVDRWRVLGGKDADSLVSMTVVPRSGFETSATIPNMAQVAVEAVDRSGAVLARSRTVAVS